MVSGLLYSGESDIHIKTALMEGYRDNILKESPKVYLFAKLTYFFKIQSEVQNDKVSDKKALEDLVMTYLLHFEGYFYRKLTPSRLILRENSFINNFWIYSCSTNFSCVRDNRLKGTNP